MLRSVLPKKSVYFSFAKITILSSTAIFAGCQRIPDQERVTKLSVADIIRNVRCELQEALLEVDFDNRNVYPEKIMRNGVPTDNWIHKATVTYGFEFETLINNNLDTTFTGIWNIPRRVGRRASEMLTLGNTADFDKIREGGNTYTGIEILSDLKEADCTSAYYKRSFRYPIKGKLDLHKILYDYYTIGNNPKLITSTYTRLLKFTVLKGGTVNPIYFISPVPQDRRTFNSSLTWSANRQDIHQVTINFNLPDEYQELANWVEPEPPKTPEPPKVTLVRIVGGEKEDSAGKTIETCTDPNDSKTCKPVQFPSEVRVIRPGDPDAVTADDLTSNEPPTKDSDAAKSAKGLLDAEKRLSKTQSNLLKDEELSEVQKERLKAENERHKAEDMLKTAVPVIKQEQPQTPTRRGLSREQIRRLEEKQLNERQIRADDSRIR